MYNVISDDLKYFTFLNTFIFKFYRHKSVVGGDTFVFELPKPKLQDAQSLCKY